MDYYHYGAIGAVSWIFSGATGVPSLQLPIERCFRVSPSAYVQSSPEIAQLRSASHTFQQKFQS